MLAILTDRRLSLVPDDIKRVSNRYKLALEKFVDAWNGAGLEPQIKDAWDIRTARMRLKNPDDSIPQRVLGANKGLQKRIDELQRILVAFEVLKVLSEV